MQNYLTVVTERVLGRGKKGWYKGIFCDSSWELAFVIYHLDHKLPIKRCTESLPYVFEGKQRKYYPDFIVDDTIYEIKGYETEQSKTKQILYPHIKLIDKDSIKMYLEYVVETYTKDFTSMYED